VNALKIEDLEKFGQSHKGWLFRGHRSIRWKLETSLERAARRCGVNQQEYERRIFEEFRRHAHTYLVRTPKDEDTLEWLALMQHHGAPTRLLDFTTSFWIALFFAFEQAEKECAVVALNPDSLRKKGQKGKDFNVFLRENIANGEHTDDFLYQDVPFFTNDRLAIQKGRFVFSFNLDDTFDDLAIKNQKEIKRLTIQSSLLPQIRERLNDFNCNSRVLYPGIDGYARYFQNHTW
jgi:hypothetical protein